MFSKIGFRLKLIGSYIIIILVSFGFIAFFLARSLEQNSLRDIKTTLIDRAHLIENQIPSIRDALPGDGRLQRLAIALEGKGRSRISIINREGVVLADSEQTIPGVLAMENHLNRPEVRSALAGRPGSAIRRSTTLKTDMLYVAVPLGGATSAGVVRLAIPLTSVERILSEIRHTVFLGLLFAVALAVIIGSLLAGHVIKPINKMIGVSRLFAKGDFTRRILQNTPDEIGELAATLNQMAQAIEDMLREIGAQNQRLAAIFLSMIEGVIIVDGRGLIRSINPAIEKIFGVTARETQGRIFLEAIRNNDIAHVIDRVLGEGTVLSQEISLVVPERRTFLVNAAPVFEHNAISGCLVVIHDITEMRRLETLRRDFVANISHELKTPLTSITGFTETLLEGVLDDRENNRVFLKIIQEHATRLNDLVNDLLALAHLESKEISLHKKDLDLHQLVEKVILGFSSQTKKKGIAIENNLPPSLTIQADEARLGQVFTNLVDNAIKFNKKNGTVTITARQTDSSIIITVEDTGLGIPTQDVERIFERFYRVDKARSRDLGGTGLGLSIVKHIVEIHGGAVSVDSTESLGSKFHITLPR